MNYSKQREIIIDTLTKNAVHPTAEKLYEIIKKEHPDSKIGIATVYRNLNKLATAGKVKKINALENSEHFDHNTHDHYHFMCNKCKQIFDIEVDIAPDIVKKIYESTGFKVTDYDIVLNGICKNCLNDNINL